jgi:hypothetical protein
MPKDEKDDEKEEHDKHQATRGTPDINGQIDADWEFASRAEELLAKLRSQKEPPAEEPERAGEKPKGNTEKHK